MASPTGSVSISGTVTQGQTLTATNNSIADGDGPITLTLSYLWQSASSLTGSWSNVSAGSTLALTEPLVGKYLQVVASYIDNTGVNESLTSNPTAAVVNVNDAPSGTVTIGGTVAQGQILTASNTLADADGLGVITYYWKVYNGTTYSPLLNNGNPVTGSTLTLDQTHVGKVLQVVASYSDGHGSSESVSSSATVAVVNVNDNPTGSVSINSTGAIAVGETLTAALSSGNANASLNFGDADGLGTITYTWQTSTDGTTWSNLSTGIQLGVSSAQLGKYLRVVASYTDNQGTSESVASSATTAVTNTNHAPTGSVTIGGTVTQNQLLTASNTLVDSDGPATLAITYSWQTSTDNSTWSPLTTGTTVTLAEAQVGKYVRVVASYIDNNGTSESKASTSTAAVANVNDSPTGAVSITGSAMQGQTLTASNTLADADGLGTISYTWKTGATILGTGSTLTLTSAEVSKQIYVTASYTDGHSTAQSVDSTTTSVVSPPNTAPTGSVTISGTVTQNQVLTASNTLADADGLGAISYVWKTSDGVTTLGTGKTLTLTESHVGKTIIAVANYTDGFNSSESVASAASAAVANVNDALTGTVTISGTVTLNQKLTAANTLSDPDGPTTLSITYTWQGSSDGTTWTDISTGGSLGLSEAQIGKYIRVKASYTDGHSTQESAYSSATGKVTNINNSPSGSVTITGTTTQNQTLTASNTLVDGDGTKTSTFSYQWQTSSDNGSTWTNLSTGATLVLAEAQVGKKVRVLANYTDDLFTSESIASSSTATVANVDDDPTGSVSIDGTAALNETLTAGNSLADPDGLGTITYTWQTSSDGSAWTSLSTGGTLGLSEAQIGKLVRVVASYTDARGSAESVASAATAAVTATSGNDGSGEVVTPVEYGGGSDKITLGDEDNFIDAGSGNNIISAGAGNDQITSGSGNDKINAGDGNNIIDAGNGKNSIVTGAGSDQITSGSGSDVIDVGAGADTVRAGAGKDKVTLGLGADILVFDNIALGGADSLVFFNATEDHFAFDATVFTALADGLTAENLVVGARPAAKESDDYLLFDTKARKLYYDADGSGSGKAILLAGVKSLIGDISIDSFSLA